MKWKCGEVETDLSPLAAAAQSECEAASDTRPGMKRTLNTSSSFSHIIHPKVLDTSGLYFDM